LRRLTYRSCWIDGFRILARRNGAGVQLITRRGNDFSPRFPFIAMVVKSLLFD